MIKKTTLLLCLTATIMCHCSFNLLDIDSISQFVPAEFLPQIQASLPTMQNIAASNPSITGLSGGAVSVPTTTASVPVPTSAPIPVPSASTAPSVAPYSPYAAPAAAQPATVMPTPTVNSAAAMAPVQLPNPVQAPAAPTASNVSNPFLGSTTQVNTDPNVVRLVYNRNSNPVFHPPFASQVPSYPPIQGQHWYQYVVA